MLAWLLLSMIDEGSTLGFQYCSKIFCVDTFYSDCSLQYMAIKKTPSVWLFHSKLINVVGEINFSD